MLSPLVHRTVFALAVALSLNLAACSTQPTPPVEAVAVTPKPLAPVVTVTPVEVEPKTPLTRPAVVTASQPSALTTVLAYADRARSMNGNEAQAELARLGDSGDTPTSQMQAALLLAQTRNSADLARAAGLLQRVAQNNSAEAAPLQPLARTLAARYLEQRRVEDERDRQAGQVRDAQRRIDQLNDRIEALRAIERSFARPAGNGAAPASRTTP